MNVGRTNQEMKVGMLIDLRSRQFDFCEKGRVEYVASDWAVVRDLEHGYPYMIRTGDDVDLREEA